ncbi:MAG: cell division protein FtsA [Candidatus Pacebacteria bacterium]|nr:cell division protein FtsA [Candidatus Paceibacterota bacterium]
MKEEIISGLDIGSSEIRLVVSQRSNRELGGGLQVIGAVSVPTSGFNKGVVSSIEDTTSSVSACIEKAERLVGVPINNVWLSVNDPKIRCERSKGVVAVGKSDGEINEADIDRAIEAAGSVAVPANYEILHVIPIRFAVDNQEDIKDPIGMSGIRLEVETLIILGLSSQLKNLTKAIYRTGLDIEDLVVSPLAAGEALLSKKQKDLGVAVINIGATTTGLSVYEEGNLLHAAILPVGSEHITSDIAIGLRCPINLAERIKIEFGDAMPEIIDKKEEINLEQLSKEEEVNETLEPVSKKYVAEIIDARVEEIFNMIDNELKKIERSGMLPAGVFLTGEGSELRNLTEAAKKYLRLPAGLGINRNLETVIDKVNEGKYSTALGLIAWASHYEPQHKPSKITKNLGDIAGKVRSWIKKIAP